MRKPLILVLVFAAVAVQCAHYTHVDNDLIFEDLPSRTNHDPWYNRLLSRAKRGFFDFFDSSSKKSDEATTVTTTTSQPTTSARETRSPEEEDVFNEPPKGPSDDEDGGLDTSGSGEAGPVLPDFLDETISSKRSLYRITLVVNEPWKKEFESKTNLKFVEFAKGLQDDINEILKDVPGEQTPDVIKIERYEDDEFFVRVTIDLQSLGNSNTKQIEDAIRDKVQSTNLGSHHVKPDSFKFNRFKDCQDTEMLCTVSELCIPLSSRCDGTPQCPNGEDENGCDPKLESETRSTLGVPEARHIDLIKSPTDDSHHCRADDAVPLACNDTSRVICTNQRCDGTEDCDDGEDEKDCPKTCLQDEFSCDISRCIPKASVCNGRPDCADKTDEQGCPVCSSDDTRCSNGACVPYMKRCDLIRDCPDGEDEENCYCRPDEFRCDGKCLPPSARCNKYQDCSDGSDEDNCPKVCDSNEWKCSDGKCILSVKRCDMHKDCIDGSDEANCPCPDDWFVCDNKHCIPMSNRCDGMHHCNDMSDERDCPRPTPQAPQNVTSFCGDGENLCESGNGCYKIGSECDGTLDCLDGSDEEYCCRDDQFTCGDRSCILKSQVCDNYTNCPDGSDERRCPRPCSPSEFRCGDGTCIPNQKKCDGTPDCSDNTDEESCDFGNCLSNEFRCKNGVCVNSEFHCDGLVDCTDGSDEENCSERVCDPNDFRCGDNKCISQTQKCDGKVDCFDGSDEEEKICRPACTDNEFQCNNGDCIPLEFLCNGRPDCFDNSDESNNDCTVSSTQSPYVTCRAGEFTCHNNRECIPRNRVCDVYPDCSDRSDELNCAPPSTTTTTTTPPPYIPPFTTPRASCAPWEFQCTIYRNCIPNHKHCDNNLDCQDGSDEENCAGLPTPLLRIYEKDQIIKESREAVFQCRDEGPGRYKVRWTREGGLSLPPGSRTIEGRLEMPNVQREHSGNYFCEAVGIPLSTQGARVSAHLTVEQLVLPTRPFEQACGIGEATCYNRQCILKTQVCDGKFDCSDGSDENRCQMAYQCEPNEFRCNNRRCVLKTWRCDKDNDCGDNSDEQGCEERRPGSQCYGTEFECRSRNQCIPRSFQCDGTNDCQDGSDETGCYPMKIVTHPEPHVQIAPGSTLVLTCTAEGVPVPEISWRRDWRHIPNKCTQSSINGTGVLTCPDFQEEDCGAYTCEAVNFITYIISPRDTIACVSKSPTPSSCPSGTFNELARTPQECISCFCFGVASTCKSADLYTFQLPPPIDTFRLMNVYISPSKVDVRRDEESSLQPSLQRTANGFSVVSSFPQSNDVHPYYALPEKYHGNQLKSYGGYLSYILTVDTRRGQSNGIPDIIILGNNHILIYRHPARIEDNRPTKISARIFEGNSWYKITEEGERYARREDIMETLVSVENILIRVQYTDGQGATTSITEVTLDSANYLNTGLGKAAYVEQCSCPPGYTGLSCERGPPCPFGYYGNPPIKSCEKCPCPLTTPPNQFTQECYLDTDNLPTCRNCPLGYTGRNCERCSDGYEGNPLIPGGECRPSRPKPDCDVDGSVSPYIGSDGRCECKDNTMGPRCSECAANTFHLASANQHGCISCFCMGVTRECSSSRLYRDSIEAIFARDDQGFQLAPEDEVQNPVPTSIEQYALTSSSFQPKVYYWVVSKRFLGNQLPSYGGQLSFRLRYVPSPGGLSSRNSAADVKIYSSTAGITFYHYSNASVEPDREQEVTVPLLEQYWQWDDGRKANRENFLMALAGLDAIYIKATYTTTTQSASLLRVHMDTAKNYNTGRGLALEVEDCRCPPGYRGLSCESCDAGYRKSKEGEGPYLGICQRCDCNDRSDDCDPDSGQCFNCRDNWTGARCDVCPPEFIESDGRCERPGRCNCDERGISPSGCVNGTCNCKVNVVGSNCDRCRDGTFNLERENPLGCSDCFCSDVSRTCQSSNLFYQPLPMQILDASSSNGFVLTDRTGRVVVKDGFLLNPARNEIGYNVNQNQDELFWSLPPQFTGDRITSYGGNLIYTRRFSFARYAYIQADYDVILNGNGKSVYWQNLNYPSSNSAVELVEENVVVPLKEGQWRRTDPRTSHAFATRRDLLEVLSHLSSIQIRASVGPDTLNSYLSDVALDIAIDQRSNKPAHAVEVCRCPSHYKGTSCQQCLDHYYRDYDNTCKPCNCNNREESCSLGSNNELHCVCQPGFVGKQCEEDSVGPMAQLKPGGHVRPYIGQLLEFKCDFQSSEPSYAVIERVYTSYTTMSSHIPATRFRMTLRGSISERVEVTRDLIRVVCKVYNPRNDILASSYAFIDASNISSSTERVPIPQPTIDITIYDPEERIQIKAIGSSVRYRCSGISRNQGQGYLRLRWSKKGGELPYPRASDDYEGNLEIVDLRVSDSGTYVCTASDGVTSQTQHVALVVGEVFVRPTIRITPPRVEAYVGEPIEIFCEGRGTPLPDLEWRRLDNGTLNPQAAIREGTLMIPYATNEDNGIYECIGRNNGGTDAKTVAVYIRTDTPPPGPDGSVIIQPPSTSASVGESVTLECRDRYSTDAEFEWRREDGRPYSAQKVGSRLIFTSTRPEDSGVYLCIVRSRSTGRIIGKAQASITVSVSPPSRPPTISPEQQRVGQGLTAEFTCEVPYDSYSAVSNIRWYKSNGELSPRAEFLNNGKILRIPQLRFEDRGIYVCYSVYRGRSYNVTAMLEVDRREAPLIELYPSDRRQILAVGNSLLLQCRVQGIPRPTIEWSKKDSSVLPPHIVASASGILRFNQVRHADTGEYICTAVNDAGRAMASTYVDVQSPPEIRVFPSDIVRLMAGENLDLTCIAEGSPTPTVRWTRRDPYSELETIDNEVSAPANYERAEYQVYQVSEEDTGAYYCIAQNDAKREVKAVQVIVDAFRGPTNQPPPAEGDLWIAVGDNTHLTCELETGQNLERRWERGDGKPLPAGVSERDGTLYIRGATKAVEGEYYCKLYQEGRVVKRIGKFISVREPPVISLYPPRQVVRPGEDAQIQCTARGEEPIEITWEADRPLTHSVVISGGLLSFRGISESDAGRYICKAKNIAGLVESAADVIVDDTISRPRVHIQGEKSRVSTQGSTVVLRCSADPTSTIGWTRSKGPLPSSAIVEGDILRLTRLQPDHSDRYFCTVRTPSGGVATDFVDLTITRDRECPGGFRCVWSGECLRLSQRCDDIPQCTDESDESNCPRRRRGAVHVSLKIEPSIDIIRVGSTVDLKCITEGIPSSQIEWTKWEDNLGPNVQTISANILRIVDVTTSNAGLYKCSARTETGTYTDDYVLNVQENSLADSTEHPPESTSFVPPSAAKTIFLKIGKSADILCNTDLEPPVSYSWLKQGGLPSSSEIQESTLVLHDVMPKDAGLYTCVATNGEVKMEIPTFLVVQGTIPSFSSSSYIKLKTLFDAYMQFDIEILFKPEDPNGLILYNGHQASTASGNDFVSFGLRNGYPEFRFDMGSGHATIVGKFPLPMGKWAKAKLNRNRKEGRLVINDEEPVIGTSQGRHQGLDLDLPLYVGSVPDFNEISKSAEFNTGFRGCISRLVIKNEEQNLTQAGALDWVGISECGTCTDNKCTNSAACQEAANIRGYICLCPKGFSGENCERTGESCYPGLCGDGYCENTQRGYICKCPLGLTGSNCENRIKIKTPAFDDTSYIAYTAPRDTGKIDIMLKMNPSDSRDALILYTAQNDFGTGNYLSLAIRDRKLEFRINTGSGQPMVLKSNTEIIPGAWITVNAGRDAREARLSIGHDMARTTLTSGQRRELLLGTFLYLGGFDTSTGNVNPAVGVSNGFRGCISFIDISKMDIEILKSAKDSSNIGECSVGNPCRENPCRNGATCVPEGSRYTCHCTPHYSGSHCEKVKNECEKHNPCGGRGKCIPLPDGYKCHCGKGFSGQNCTIREHITTSFNVEGDGWAEFPKSMLADVGDETELEFNIVTDSSDGIIFWHGHDINQPPTGISDFLAVAVVEGYVEVVFELGSGVGRVVSESQVNDGQPHSIRVARTANTVQLFVDGKSTIGQSEGILSTLNANGSIYVGGVPDPRTMTQGRYLNNFHGCIRDIRIQNNDVLDLSNSAMSTVNLKRCPVAA